MAPLPKRRHSTQRSGKRQKSRRLNKILLINCPNCGQPTKPHLVCPSCGYYNNRLILPKKEEKKKSQ